MKCIPPSIVDLFYELANKASLEGWDIKIDMNRGTAEHHIHCKPNGSMTIDILPNSVEPTTQVFKESE